MREEDPKRRAPRRWMGGALAAAVLGIGAAMPVQAAVFVGTFDPQFGSPLTFADGGPFDLGWRGTVTVNTTDECLAEAALSTTGVVAVGVGGCAASVLAASVGLYEMPPSGMPPPAVDGATLDFDPIAFTVSFLQFDVLSRNLRHLSTSFSNPVFTPYTAGFGPIGAAFQWFSLEFLLDADLNGCGSGSGARSESRFGSPLDGGCDPDFYSGPALWVDTADRQCNPGAEASRCTRSDLAEFPAELSFMRAPGTGTPVSAPASLALVLLAAATGAGATALRRARSGTRSGLSS